MPTNTQQAYEPSRHYPYPVDLHFALAERRAHAKSKSPRGYVVIYSLVIIAVLLLLWAYARPTAAHAAPLYANPYSDISTNADTGYGFYSDVTGQANSLTLYVSNSDSTARAWDIYLQCWNGADPIGGGLCDDGGGKTIQVVRLSIPAETPKTQVVINLTDFDANLPAGFSITDMTILGSQGEGSFDLVEGMDYCLRFDKANGSTGQALYGSDSNPADAQGAFDYPCDRNSIGSFEGPYFWLDGNATGPDDTGAANIMLAITEPEAFSTTASTTFDTTIRYQRGTQPLTGYELRFVHLSSGANDTYNFFLEDVPAGTIETITEEIVLDREGTYRLEATLFSGMSTSTPSIPKSKQYGQGSKVTSFAVVAADIPFDYDSIPGYENPDFPSDSCNLDWDLDFDVGNCLGLLFIPTNAAFGQYQTLTLANSFPFAYAFQLTDIKDALYANASTEDQAVTVEILGGELTLISRDMIASVPFAPLIKEMLSAIMWFLLAYALYRMVIKAHDTTTHV